MLIDITKIERIKLEPGEAIHVKAGVVLSNAQITGINDIFVDLFPGNKVVISDRRVDISLEAIKVE